MTRLHQDTCRPETCISDKQLVSGYYMSTDKCRRIHVARSGYMLTVSRRHNYYSFMSRSTCIVCIQQQRATNRRQFCRRHKKHVDGDKWIQVDTTCIRQHVSWCKRGFSHAASSVMSTSQGSNGIRLDFSPSYKFLVVTTTDVP